MSDERAREAIAKWFYAADAVYLDTWDSQPEERVKEWYRDKARAGVAALRAAGYEIVRVCGPEEGGE